MPWAQRSTFPMLFFLLLPHQARGLSLAWWWQSLVHGCPISRWEDGDEADENKGELLVSICDKGFEEEGKLERRRKIVVVTPLHILQWTGEPQLILVLAHCVIMFCVWRDLSKLFWFFLPCLPGCYTTHSSIGLQYSNLRTPGYLFGSNLDEADCPLISQQMENKGHRFNSVDLQFAEVYISACNGWQCILKLSITVIPNWKGVMAV